MTTERLTYSTLNLSGCAMHLSDILVTVRLKGFHFTCFFSDVDFATRRLLLLARVDRSQNFEDFPLSETESSCLIKSMLCSARPRTSNIQVMIIARSHSVVHFLISVRVSLYLSTDKQAKKNH